MDENLQNRRKSEFGSMKADEKIIWISGQYEVPQTISREEAFDNLKKKMVEREAKSKIRLNKWHYMLSAAAIIILFIGFWFLQPKERIENFVAERGQQTDYKLPDGSKITMNADTRVSFKKKKFRKERNVEFEGEAFFNIEKGKAFTVKTEYADIKILGTSFNVFARENRFNVSCFTGKILVSSGSDSLIIEPGQTAYIEDNKLLKHDEQNINSKAKWRVGEFNYENAPLNFVFNEIERQFNVTFVLPDIQDKKFTGTFTNKNLVNTLDIICIPMHLEYEIGSNSKIFIKIKPD